MKVPCVSDSASLLCFGAPTVIPVRLRLTETRRAINTPSTRGEGAHSSPPPLDVEVVAVGAGLRPAHATKESRSWSSALSLGPPVSPKIETAAQRFSPGRIQLL
ncbi:hypothetical protein NDU88_003678 [Pleurodeles waltl]|uniref:Uncharacterized protein n=1 Tax=Pleurodeles waltl TaxID=8319 RepID=A0AAV7RDK5_PLEWA|nr:hypothetical protein NDU88_003678 [Pleurodeles waltl]